MTLQPKQWAVVTGASGGLGEQFARQLAARGLNLTLVARSAGKLAGLAAELSAAHGVSVDVRPADLSDPAAVSALAADLFGRAGRPPVDLLVNNAGLGYVSPLVDQTDRQVHEMLSVNVDAVVRLTHAAVVAMTPRRAGAVLNIGSMAGFQPIPRMAVYAAAKAFVMGFGEAVSHECRGTGVRVTTFCPGVTRTGFEARSGSPARWFKRAKPADAVVAKAIRAVEAGRVLKTAYLGETLLSQTVRFMPRRLVVAVTAAMTRA